MIFMKLFKEDKSIRAILDYYPIVTNSFNAINPDDIKEDVINLYDNLIDNIDEIIQELCVNLLQILKQMLMKFDCRVWALCEIGNTDNFIYGNNIEDFIKWCAIKRKLCIIFSQFKI